MEPFRTLEAPACALARANVDTDQLIPARFMKRSRAQGYGPVLLHDLRFGPDGEALPDSPLDRPDRPMPVTAAMSRGSAAASASSVSQPAVHQCSGSCSDQPGWGCAQGYSAEAEARIVPRSSVARVFVPDVPMSMPRVTLTA